MSTENEQNPRPEDVAAPREPVVEASAPVQPAVAQPTIAQSPGVEPVIDETVTPQSPNPEPRLAAAPAGPLPEYVPAAAPPAGLPGEEIYGAPVVAAPVYRPLPTPPRRAGNRGMGALIALVGTVAFAVVYAGVASVIFAFTVSLSGWLSTLVRFIASPAFITPVVFFAVGLILLVVIVNRARWWAYVLGGFPVAVFVYAGTIVGALLTVQGWTLSVTDQISFVTSLVMDPLPLAAGIVAREATIWAGVWLSFRGRRVTARNTAARAEHESALADAAALRPLTTPAR